jgi:hypothetical protein
VCADLRGEPLVYGDLSRLLNLKVSGKMSEVSETYRELKNLDTSLFVGFVTYILARAGYCNMTMCEKWRINGEMLEMKQTCSACPLHPKLVRDGKVDWADWIQASFAWAEEMNELWEKYGEAVDRIIWDLLSFLGTWSHYFENTNDKTKVKMIFTEWLPLSWNLKKTSNLREWRTLSAIDPSCSNLILVKPDAYKKARREDEVKLKELRDLLLKENIRLVSVDEFVDKFVARDQKETELTNWVAIKNDVLENLLRMNSILVIALEWERINEVEAHLKVAKQEYENAKNNMDFKHAVRDATYAVEALLKILYHKHFGKEAPSGDEGTWKPLQNKLQEMITAEFGEIVHSDLEFLHMWRNYESHPNPPALTRNIVFQVISRSEAFYNSVKATLNEFELPTA